MAVVDLKNVYALMVQSDTAVTHPDGGTYTMPANTPFTTASDTLDIPGGTVVALMRNVMASNGKPVQVFSIDEIITVA